jgi:ABC-type transport system involved in cytochrome bd biosynthesis fused ATPase/permease subunit
MALALVLGALAVGFGVALMTAAGYLISRAAEQPPILALTTTIVVVRFLALARPLARYLERLASHDLALRALGRIRSTVYRDIEPLAPGELDAYRRGDLVNRLVADVDALQGLYIRGIGPPLVALVVSTACVVATAVVLSAAAVVLALGLALGGVAVPLLAARLSRFVGRRQAVARGELASELTEILRGAPELAAYGREDDAFDRVASADAELRRLGRRTPSSPRRRCGPGTRGRIDARRGARARRRCARDRDARSRAGGDAGAAALSSFDAVAPLPAAARDLPSTLASGARVLELTAASLRSRPSDSSAAPSAPVAVALEDVTARYGNDRQSSTA